MKKEQFEYLVKIYNSLLLVETKGENTILMGDILKAFNSLINNINEQGKEENE